MNEKNPKTNVLVEMFYALIQTKDGGSYESPQDYHTYGEARRYLDEHANDPDFKSGTIEKRFIPVEVLG